MNDIKTLVRPNILSLKPYNSARDEFKGNEGVFLDANENPFGELNRYPDPYQKALKEQLSSLKNIPVENIFIGNGSDEVIDVLLRIFCTPDRDKIVICPPTYGMYEVSANINAIGLVSIPLNDEFQLNLEAIETVSQTNEVSDIKMIFLCSPNNPTGNTLVDIEKVLRSFKGIVIVDEAYIDFCEASSYIEKLKAYPNLVVMQTFSKAWGLAAARVGVAYASNEIIALMNKVKPPYNVSKLNQEAAIEALGKADDIQQQKELIITQRNWLKNELAQLLIVSNVYPSDSNFILIEVTDADDLYTYLVERKMITRNRNSVVKNCIRITVGTEEENQQLIEVLKNY